MTHSSPRRTLAALAVLAVTMTGLTATVGTAPAQADTRSTTFTTSGVFTVPAAITSVHVVATGGSGGRSFDSVAGGRGAVVEADLTVTPGQELQVHVGGRGADSSYPGGGAGGANGGAAGGSFTSGGGGGASDVRLTGDALTDRILVAAGGGGATFGGSIAGGDAGAAGTRLTDCASGTPAQPGTQDAGGIGSRAWGDCAYFVPGGDGSFGVGGAGGFNSGSNNSGGGGGGGWYGGGGGGQYASGAGGSSRVDPTVGSGATTSLAGYGTAPKVVISYARLAQAVAFTGDIPSDAVAGTSYELGATGGASGNAVTFSLGGATTDACTLAGSTLTFTHAGTCEVEAAQLGDDSYIPGSTTHTISVAPAETTTNLHVEAGTVSADVLVSAPSTLDAAGSVQFLLGDQVAGIAPLVDGTATLDQAVPDGDADTVTAEFVGTADLATSSDDSNRASQEITVADSTPSTAIAGTFHSLGVTGGESGTEVRLTAGAATTADSCSVSGTVVTFAHTGTCQVAIDQDGDWLFRPAATTRIITVDPASTATAVSVQPHTVTATVGVAAPSTLAPTGTVRFRVGGSVVGTADVVAGMAVLGYTVPPGATRVVSAEFLGSADVSGSSASTSRPDPTIAATVTSARNPVAGWYRTPVTVSFVCQANGAAVLQCPAAQVLKKSAAGQSASGTATAADGGAATATVTGISIDSGAPQVKVTGVKKGKKYTGKKLPKPACAARDALSGPAGCTLTQTIVKYSSKRTVIRYTALARDRAGNTAKVVGTYTLVSKLGRSR